MFWLTSFGQAAESFDLVIRGGRVIDPETGLDAVRDVGIRGDRIARISAQPLSGGARVIEAQDLVVAPGFIDLHQHQHDLESYRLKALDGVTMALELETGVPDVERFVEVRRGNTPIHFGANASQEAARVAAWDLPLLPSTLGPEASMPDPTSGSVTNDPASSEQLERMLEFLRAQLDAGALGVGVGLEYTPGASRQEVVELFRLAATYGRPVFIHARSAGRIEPGSSIASVLEVIAAAAVTGAPAHIVHLNSTCLGDSPTCLVLIEGARTRGLDVTTEAYPYGTGMTYINSAVFNPGWRERRGLDYGDLEVPETGERLTQEQFEKMHSSPEPRQILIHMNPDAVVDAVIENSLIMVASDGIRDHPRNAGTYSRVLARQVREKRTLTLLEAVRKMALMPAQRLEAASSDARRKGRLQEGADADIVVFDLERIQDRATFRASTEPSIGIRYLIVAGTVVVDEGDFVEASVPGRPLLAGTASGINR
jgi:N-acyl-D-aspartate/D-glutamate deacylase